MPLNDFVFNENAVKIFKTSLKNNTIAHAYLFVGPEGVGKMSLSIGFAKALNCLNIKNDYCGICQSCRKINENSYPDVHIYKSDGGNIKIETIRNIEKDVSYKPFGAGKKFYIIDNADKMLEQSANAFLKTLEEPPSNTIFILLVTNLKNILSTIISRCQVVRFGLIEENILKQYLEKKYNLGSEEALGLAKLADGRIGKAEKLLGKDEKKAREKVLDFLMQIPEVPLLVLLSYSDLFAKNRAKSEYFLSIFFIWFRDILMIKSGRNEYVINFDYKIVIENSAQYYTYKKLLKISGAIEKARFYIKRNLNLRLIWESLIMEIKENTN